MRCFLKCFLIAGFVCCKFNLSAQDTFKLIAHRGGPGTDLPENSLAAVERAVKSGIRIIEIDVRMSRDSVVYLMHDNNIDRTTDGKGMLREYSSDELRAFNLKGSKEKIPELEEVMQVVKGRCALLVEIKSDGKKNRGAEEKIIDLIRKYDAYGWCFIQSFHDKALERVHEADSNVVLFKTMLGKCPFMPVIIDKGFRFRSLAYYDYVAGFCVHRCLVTRSIVKKLHSSGRVLYAWTVNKDRNRVRLMKKGVNGVMTDYY